MRKDARRRSSMAPNPLKSLEENFDDEESLSDSLQDDSVPPNSWFYDGELEQSEVKFLEPKERVFWEEFINEYLLPINDNKQKKVKNTVIILQNFLKQQLIFQTAKFFQNIVIGNLFTFAYSRIKTSRFLKNVQI